MILNGWVSPAQFEPLEREMASILVKSVYKQRRMTMMVKFRLVCVKCKLVKIDFD